MKRILVVRAVMTLILAAVCMSTWADEVTAEQALEQAQQFVSSHNNRRSAPIVTSAGQVSGLYVFNVSNGGFVIVSNDDQTVPILGFGESGNIDPDDLPDNMRAWLQGYADQIAWLQANGTNVTNRAPAVNRTNRTAKTDIGPLVQTKWDQGAPYNNLCPTIDGTKTVTGCVATTMAQLMYYHQWPRPETVCTDIPSYTTTTKDKNGASYSLTVSGLIATTFEWDKMIPNYTPIDQDGKRHLAGSTEQRQAVAKLMLYCGTALQMMYGLSTHGGSSAYSEAIPYALKTIFGYDGGIQHCYRKNYSYEAWMDLIYSELKNDRPVALGGQSCGGGHSFICDGYKYENAADYFHINWGWAGSSDGYFPLSVLQPWEQGIGGSSTLDGFSFGQDAVIGIQPPVEDNADYCLSLEGLRLGSNETSKEFTRANVTEAFTGINLYYLVYNYNYGSNAFDVAVQLVDGSGNVVHTLGGQDDQTKTWNKTISGTLNDLSIPSSVGGGTYYIKVMSRPHNNPAVAWQECFDGDAYKLTATISNDKLKLTINVPIPNNVTPTRVTFAVSGQSYTGAEQTVTATVTGGKGDYSGDLVLRVNGKAVMGQIAHIPAGQDVVLNFSYIPSQVGDNTLTLWTHRSEGSPIGDPGTVTINTLVFDNDGSNNTKLIEKNKGRIGNVKLAGRTLTKDGNWNTLCLPFAVVLEGSPLEGATVKELNTSASNLAADGTLTLNFTTATSIEAGKPYIVKWDNTSGSVSDPVFNTVTISNSTTPTEVKSSDNKVTFVGQYSPFAITENNKNEIIMLGSGSTLGYSKNTRTLKCFRAHFYVKSDGSEQAARAFVLDFGEGEQTGISLTPDPSPRGEGREYYTIDGRKLNSMPTQKGIYIVNGKKIVVK